uniref:Copia-like retroelement n=1 Tax=Oryza sativa subsp. japonica TaxID=39947 RepID=Q94I66_ORYSJ|nr:Putative copia-like retroelement [Oryza sativa Japonica Group]
MCARFQAALKECHLVAMKRILRYLVHTPNLGLWYPKGARFDLIGYADADYVGCKVDRKSTSGTCQFLGRSLVSWSSKKQNSVTLSTAEAEYVSARSCCAQLLWMKQTLRDYGLNVSKIPLICDNESAIKIANNHVQHSRTKHIDIRHHFLRDHSTRGDIDIQHVRTDKQLADIFTKPLDEARFYYPTWGRGQGDLTSPGCILMIKGQFKNQVYSRRVPMSSRGRSPTSKARHAIRRMSESRKDAIDTQAQASEDIAAQVANVERDSGSHAPSFEEEIQLEEDIAAQQAAHEEGPFFVTAPSRDPNYHRRVTRWNRKWTEVEKERKKDPYKYQQLSTDPRFWNLFQQDYYETVIAPKKGAILMQWVDWKYMEELHDPIINEVIEACARQNLKELMGLQYPWCKEIIAQFYATVYFEPNKEKIIHWMTDGIIYSVTYAKFAAILGFPARSRTNRVKIHDEKPMDTNSLHFLYQDVDYELGTIKGLLPFYAYLNKLLRKTLNPKEGDASNVLAYTRNLLHKMKAHPQLFDAFDFIFEKIWLISMIPKRGHGYGPYIMKMIEIVSKKKFHKEVAHTGYQVRPIKAVSVPAGRTTRASSRAGPSATVTSSDSNSSLRSSSQGTQSKEEGHSADQEPPSQRPFAVDGAWGSSPGDRAGPPLPVRPGALSEVLRPRSEERQRERKCTRHGRRRQVRAAEKRNTLLLDFLAILALKPGMDLTGTDIPTPGVSTPAPAREESQEALIIPTGRGELCSPDGFEVEDSGEDVFEDPFAAEASSSRADRGKAPMEEEEEEEEEDDNDEESSEEDKDFDEDE